MRIKKSDMNMPISPTHPPSKIVRCPNCAGDSLFSSENAYRPFCSERCKNMDFGGWASESFRMPADEPPDEQIFGDAKLQ